MRPKGWLRTVIALPRKIIAPLDAAFRHATLADLGYLGINVPNQPVRKQADRCVRIVHDEGETFRFRRRSFDPQSRTDILPILAEFLRNGLAVSKC